MAHDFDALISEVVSLPEPPARILAIRNLVRACQESPEVPFEQILDMLDARTALFPQRLESDPDVRGELSDARRRVCDAQRRAVGFRVRRPPSDENLWGSVVRPLFWAADIHRGRAELEEVLAEATPGQRGLFAIHWTSSEVRNGGLHQYFSNSTGVVWPDAVAGFRHFELGPLAALLEEAGSVFVSGKPPADHAQRCIELADIDPTRFESLDARFYALQDLLSVESVVEDFIRTHPGQFFR